MIQHGFFSGAVLQRTKQLGVGRLAHHGQISFQQLISNGKPFMCVSQVSVLPGETANSLIDI